MADSTPMTPLERRLVSELDAYLVGIADPRPAKAIAATAIDARGRTATGAGQWHRVRWVVVLVAAALLVAASLIVGIGGFGPSLRPAPSADPLHPLAGEPGWLAYTIGDSTDQRVRLVRTDGTDDHQILADDDRLEDHPEWSLDGRRLVLVRSDSRDGARSIWSYDPATDTPTELLACVAPCVDATEPSWSPGRDAVVYFFADDDPPLADIPDRCGLRILTVSTGAIDTLVERPCGPGEPRFPRWSPRDSQVAYLRSGAGPTDGSLTWQVVVRDLTTGEERDVGRPIGPVDGDAGLDWSPDGAWLAVTDGDGVLTRIRVDGGEATNLFTSTDRTLSHPRYSPDGRWLLVGRTLESALPGLTAVSVTTVAIDPEGGIAVEVLPEGPSGTDQHYGWMSLQASP